MQAAILAVTAAFLVGLLFAAPEPAIKRLDGNAIERGQIDQTVLRLMSAAEVTGVGISIFNNGNVAFSKAYGLRDLPKNAPLTQDSVIAGASLTKAAFAYLVMQLVDAEVVDLDSQCTSTCRNLFRSTRPIGIWPATPGTRRSRLECC